MTHFLFQAFGRDGGCTPLGDDEAAGETMIGSERIRC